MTGPSDGAIVAAEAGVSEHYNEPPGYIARAALAAAYPLIKADIEATLREQIAREIDSAKAWLSASRDDRYQLGGWNALTDAARIVRGGEAS